MKLGLFGIGSGPCADPEVALTVARAAEAAGYESLWTGEHVVLPNPRVPPSPAPPSFPMLHPSTILSFLAAATERVRLGTGIVILPQRNPVVLAKELASLDVLSAGRLVFGLGVGYLKPEFDALGVAFSQRGERSDEYLDAVVALWTQENPSYQGRYVSFRGVQAMPRPVQKPHPPIVIGGMSASAYRRAVARGNGWYGFALDLDATKRSLEGIEKARGEVSRPPELGPLEISITPSVPLDRETVERFADLGVHRLIPLTTERTADALVAFVENTAEAVAGVG
jgi:probable F420-dependent oxidoreductase